MKPRRHLIASGLARARHPAALLVLLLLGWLLPGGQAIADTVFVIPLDSVIHPLAEEVVLDGLAAAGETGASLVVLELDTPGGLMSSTETILEAVVGSPIPVVGYVHPQGGSADSAGFFILMACDLAVMSPGTNTGAASPVAMFGGESQGEDGGVMERKIRAAAAARLRSLIERRGRNLEQAELAVTEPRSFTADEALDVGLIELIAADYPSLLEALADRELVRVDGRRQRVQLESPELMRYEWDLRQRVLDVLGQPQIAYLLLLLGAVGLYTELTHPGGVVPGVVGALSLLLAFYGMSVLPVNWLGLLLLGVGVAMLALEVKVTSYGALAVAGTLAMVFGSLLLFDGPIPELRVGLGLVLPTVAVVALIVVALLAAVLRSYAAPPRSGAEGLVGEQGETRTDLDPEGQVFVHGELWRGVARQPIPSGVQVRITAVSGLKLEVEQLTPEQPIARGPTH